MMHTNNIALRSVHSILVKFPIWLTLMNAIDYAQTYN